jgi:hypothetical protein
MKKLTVFILSILFGFSLNAQQNTTPFYYYQGEKIFLTEKTEKIFLKLATNADKASLLSFIRADLAQPIIFIHLT